MKTPHSKLPQWIGVKKGWHLQSADPLPHLVSITSDMLRTHALLIGATRSGKTNLVHHLVAQDIEREHSLVVLDLRGDLVDSVLELAAGRVSPEMVVLIDLREKDRPHGFNPLFGPGEPYFRALGVLDAIANESESWGIQLAETLRYALMLFAEIGKPITELDQLFYDGAFRLQCLAMAEASPTSEFWERFHALSPDKQQSLAMPVLNKLSILTSTKSLRKVLGHRSPVDLGAHLNTPGSITLISLAVDELHGAAKMMGNMILSSICREVFARVQVGERSRNPVRIFVDEFEHFVLQDFENLLAEGRRFGASLVLAHQTLAQLTPKMRSMILGNVGVKFAFRAGREDSQTLCKDLSGDPTLVDLNNFRTGEALMWVRGEGVDVVEINEPLLPSTGFLSKEAQEFRSQILAARVARDSDEDEPGSPATRTDPSDPTAPRPGRVSRPTVSPEPLEDWLCN